MKDTEMERVTEFVTRNFHLAIYFQIVMDKKCDLRPINDEKTLFEFIWGLYIKKETDKKQIENEIKIFKNKMQRHKDDYYDNAQVPILDYKEGISKLKSRMEDY